MAVVRRRAPKMGPYGAYAVPGARATAQGYVMPKVQARPVGTTAQFTARSGVGPPRSTQAQSSRGSYAPHGGQPLPAAPSGQWWNTDYTGGDPNFTVQGAINSGLLPPGSADALGNLGYYRAPLNIPGYHPDLSGGVMGDFETQAAQNAIAAANAADAAGAKASINALAVGWGGDLANMVKSGLIDQKTADAAKANQFSQMANLQHALDQGGGQLQNQLAARGILNSGALSSGNTQLQYQYQGQTQQGLQDLMSKVNEIRHQQASAAADRQGSLAGVYGDVASRLSQDPAYQAIPDQQAFWDASTGSYVDDWGRRYNQQGQRVG